MIDLFRFVLLRPPAGRRSGDVVVVEASSAFGKRLQAAEKKTDAAAAVRELALNLLDASNGDSGLTYADAMGKLRSEIGARATAARIARLTEAAFGEPLSAVVELPTLIDDVRQAGDLLIAARLASTAAGHDLPSLVAIVAGHDLLVRAHQASSEHEELAFRPLTIASAVLDVVRAAGAPAKREAETAKSASSARGGVEPSPELGVWDQALSVIANVSADDVKAASVYDVRQISVKAVEHGRAAVPPGLSRSIRVGRVSTSPLTLTKTAVQQLPPLVVTRLQASGVDPSTAPLVKVAASLRQLRAEAVAASAPVPKPTMFRMGARFYPSESASDYGDQPSRILTSKIQPIGIGDLLVVKQHTKDYDGGDVAYIENVLKSEQRERRTRRLEKTSETNTTSTETTKDEERDTQTTDRFSLQRESADTVKSDSQLKSGVAVTASYGPTVQVKASMDAGTSTSTQDSSKLATAYSKDVVARATTKLTEKITESQTITSILEFEEKNRHGFDNTTGTENISGVYQWLDKITEAQVYNYGRRMLFDVVLPDPAAFYVYALQHQVAAGSTLVQPPDLTITAADLDESNYLSYAALYSTTGLEPPPAYYRIATKQWDFSASTGPNENVAKADSVTIDDGYQAYSWSMSALFFLSDGMVDVSSPGSSSDIQVGETGTFTVLVGQQSGDFVSKQSSGWQLDGETGTIPVSFLAQYLIEAVVDVEIVTTRTDTAFATWRSKTYDAIAQAYANQLQQYQSAVADAQAQAVVGISGRSPEANAAVIRAELIKGCIELLSEQQFDWATAMTSDFFGLPEFIQYEAIAHGKVARFFQEAFEWEQIVYLFYPYYWSNKSKWVDQSLYDDVDSDFADFLRAGAARVVFGVRPGFERAVIHYLETGQIWDGGEPPNVTSPLYVPLAVEIAEAEQAPGKEVPQGEPWEVRLPTTLVRLRPDDSLPTWRERRDGSWVETS